jgi:Protein of unknown function (DUF2950)
MQLQALRTRVVLIGCALAFLLGGCDLVGKQKTYASPQEAADGLVAALKAENTGPVLRVLGKDSKSAIESGDPIQDRNARARFVELYGASHSLEEREDGSQVIQVGPDNWPFPFPLVQENGKWHFDSTAGSEEIIDRRVGRNELSAIQACLAYVDAQREYYTRNADNDPLLHYAQQLISSPGKHDGLYWDTSGDEAPSPLGPAFAKARSQGYLKDSKSGPEPFHGYYYALLKAQGPNAAGGAYDYVVRDKMIGGFALIAYPAEYGNSGVVTFMVNHDGVVFSKDLGPDTAKLAPQIKVFDPDSSWKREDAS